MAKLFRRTMEYLGLIDEAEVQDAEAEVASRPRVTAQPTAATEPVVRTLDPVSQPVDSAPPLRPASAIGGRRVEPPQMPRRGSMMAGTGAAVTVSSGGAQSAPAVTAAAAESHLVVPTHFDDAKIIADHIKGRTAVVLDLRAVDPDMVRRLVDFVSGLVYSLDGTMRKIAQGVILVSPARVTLSRTERRRLAEIGLYELVDNE